MATQQEKFERFSALHDQAGAFVVGNPWDAGTTRILTQMGYPALATTSAGLGFTLGKRSSFAALTRQEILENARIIVEATDLPVTADLEDGFGIDPYTCAETITMSLDVGLVGGSIEDATGHVDAPILDLMLATDRIAAAAEAKEGKPFLLTARAENFLWGRHDLDDTIKRLNAFADAGADVLYAPGLSDLNDIRTLCREVNRPVNVVMGLVGANITMKDLDEAGVKRVSVGGSFARAAFDGMIRAAEEVLDHGTFTYSKASIGDTTLGEAMSKAKATHRT